MSEVNGEPVAKPSHSKLEEACELARSTLPSRLKSAAIGACGPSGVWIGDRSLESAVAVPEQNEQGVSCEIRQGDIGFAVVVKIAYRCSEPIERIYGHG